MAVMDGLPVTFRTLDPPLHEFVPNVRMKEKSSQRASTSRWKNSISVLTCFMKTTQ
jgi:phosphoenolpyruvate synthase/pyruvate phosphate dikinase